MWKCSHNQYICQSICFGCNPSTSVLPCDPRKPSHHRSSTVSFKSLATCTVQCLDGTIAYIDPMFSRLSQVARHLSRPLPNYAHASAASSAFSATTRVAMAQERSKRMINTAACLIIGDEVLGGKVSHDMVVRRRRMLRLKPDIDCRHQQRLVREVLLLHGHQP